DAGEAAIKLRIGSRIVALSHAGTGPRKLVKHLGPSESCQECESFGHSLLCRQDQSVVACSTGGGVNRVARKILTHGPAILVVLKGRLTGNVYSGFLFAPSEQMVALHSFISGASHKTFRQLALEGEVPLLDDGISHGRIKFISEEREGELLV